MTKFFCKKVIFVENGDGRLVNWGKGDDVQYIIGRFSPFSLCHPGVQPSWLRFFFASKDACVPDCLANSSKLGGEPLAFQFAVFSLRCAFWRLLGWRASRRREKKGRFLRWVADFWRASPKMKIDNWKVSSNVRFADSTIHCGEWLWEGKKTKVAHLYYLCHIII